MTAAAKYPLIAFLTANNIKWMPIADMKLDDKGKKVFDETANREILKYVPTCNDFTQLTDNELKQRQKKYKLTTSIAIDTTRVALIDCDNANIPQEIISVQEKAPYILSYSKQLPKIFVILENKVNKKNIKTKWPEMEIQAGMWSFSKINAVVHQSDMNISEINIASWIAKADKKLDETKRLLKKLDDCRVDDYEMWRNVGMCIKNEHDEAGYDIFDKWSKQSESKYDEVKNRQMWDSWPKYERMNLFTLKSYLKADDTKNELKSPRRRRRGRWWQR